jgi:hypothetical protein
MSRSDSRPGPPPGLFIPPARWSRHAAPPRRVSQVPRLICPRALSPSTPEGLAAALAPCFTASVRLHPRGRTGHLQVPLTRPNRVHLRYGSRVRFARLRRTNYSVSRSLSYLSNGQLQGKLLSAYKISQAFLAHPRQGRQNLAQGASPGLGLREPASPGRGERRCDGTTLTPLRGYGLMAGSVFPGLGAVG